MCNAIVNRRLLVGGSWSLGIYEHPRRQGIPTAITNICSPYSHNISTSRIAKGLPGPRLLSLFIGRGTGFMAAIGSDPCILVRNVTVGSALGILLRSRARPPLLVQLPTVVNVQISTTTHPGENKHAMKTAKQVDMRSS